MAELIAILIFFTSLIGLGVITFRKIPILTEMPETSSSFDSRKAFIRLKEKAIELNPLKNFSSDIFLQKVISKTRVLVMKVENRMSSWLQDLREQSQKKKEKENDDYWENLKDKVEKS